MCRRVAESKGGDPIGIDVGPWSRSINYRDARVRVNCRYHFVHSVKSTSQVLPERRTITSSPLNSFVTLFFLDRSLGILLWSLSKQTLISISFDLRNGYLCVHLPLRFFFPGSPFYIQLSFYSVVKFDWFYLS